MVNTTETQVKWYTAPPLWDRALAEEEAALLRPAILRFSNDDFMKQLSARLAGAEPDLASLLARPETQDTPEEAAAGWLSESELRAGEPLRLYQPAHGRFYLVAASLVCWVPGLPDRSVLDRAGETTAFVLRRLGPREKEPLDPWDGARRREYAWVPGQGWKLTEDPDHEAFLGEELLPLIPLRYRQNEQQRRVLIGYVPVSSQDTYVDEGLPDLQGTPLPKFGPDDRTWYVLRCVYDRPCGNGWQPAIVSAASVPFRIAPFFDPDAPARPVRITMPVDTSAATLRRYKKNISILASEQFRAQMERLRGKGIKDLDSPDPAKPQSLGMICSLSIPIITMVAMALLMAIVNALDLIFQWKSFFKSCFELNLKR